MIDEREDRARDLAKFANADAQPNQPIAGGHALVRPTTGLADRIVGAQQVAVYRDEGKILQKLSALAAAAGSDWFYRFPVKKRDGGQDWIEGPSIKLANDCARIFGNNVNEVREIDVGDAWIFYARFTDIETGFSMERAYRQRKTQTSLKTKDADRQLDIAYQIGQSKAIRNCIVNALQIYCDYAFDKARDSLIDKIGKDLAGWRERTLEGIKKMPMDLARVERVIGRASRDWLAPQIAQIISMMRAVHDGMSTSDETFPPIVEAKPAAPETTERQESQPQSTSASTPEETAASPAAREVAASGTADAGVEQTPESTAGVDPAEWRDQEQAAQALAQGAFDRGSNDFKRGVQRKAVPTEWRTAETTRLATAWLNGWESSRLAESTKDQT
jgi:hypothetical protein